MVEEILLIIVLEVFYNAIYLEKSKGWLNKNYWMKEKFYLSQFYFYYYYSGGAKTWARALGLSPTFYQQYVRGEEVMGEPRNQ